MTKSAQDALSDKFFASAFFNASIGMALVAPDGKWLAVNNSLCALVGYTETELLSKTFQDITHPDDLNEDLGYVEQMLAGKIATYQMEKRYFHKNGNIINILLSVSLVRDDKGEALFFISQIQDITTRKQLEADLMKLAAEDYLTGVCNRRCFFDAAKREMQRSDRLFEVMTILIIDIDHFKQINDKYGHDIGDYVLKVLATTGKNTLRNIDIFARLGGEEFGALLVNTDAQVGRLVAERLRQHIMKLSIETERGMAHITVSIGGVSFSGALQSIDYRLKQADELLYQVKNEGRNAVKIMSDVEAIATDQIQAGFIRLIWQDAYDCGNETIDKQHRNLFELSNLLLNSLISGASKSASQDLILRLINHIEAHFDDEEGILRLANYPNIDDHIKMHLALVCEAKKLAERFRENDISVGELFSFLTIDVISKHMKDEDIKYYLYLKD